MLYENYSERVHMSRTHELASEFQPYERVPNILRFSFNKLFITCIYPNVRNGRFVNAYSWLDISFGHISCKMVSFLTTYHHIATHAELRRCVRENRDVAVKLITSTWLLGVVAIGSFVNKVRNSEYIFKLLFFQNLRHLSWNEVLCIYCARKSVFFFLVSSFF